MAVGYCDRAHESAKLYGDRFSFVLKYVLVLATVRSQVYARSPGLAIDVTALDKLARTFDVLIEDLDEIVQE